MQHCVFGEGRFVRSIQKLIRAGREDVKVAKGKDPVGHVDSDPEEGATSGYTATQNLKGYAFGMGPGTQGTLKF